MTANKKHFLVASDFDQTLSFNDSGAVLSELIGASRFEEKVAGLARKAVAVLPAAAQDLAFEGAIDLPMFRRFGGFRPTHDKMI